MPPLIISKIKNYFTFSKSQKAGVIILSAILLLFIAGWFVLPDLIDGYIEPDISFKAEVAAFVSSAKTEPTEKFAGAFPFDPNSISKPQMTELGLTEYQAEMILKYRQAGGEFRENEDFKKIYSITDEDYLKLEPFIHISRKEPVVRNQIREHKLTPVPFDPNTADSNLLSGLGLSQKQVSQIINYRKAGGIFRIKSDFAGIYCISDREYRNLEKYILLPSTPETVHIVSEKSKRSTTASQKILVEINSADTSDLEKLYGIGPYYAKRIIDYRSRLGGFYSKSQLLEVYGIDSTRYFGFADQVEVNRRLIHKIDLNRADFKTILNHPYFEYYLVKAIFNYKDAVGDFVSVNELKEIDLMYDELFYKVVPYLQVENEISHNEKVD